eukprot:8715241-Ditylum_brightwellii.AAC.1
MDLSVEDKANEDMNLEEFFSNSDEGDIALGITDNTKSEHPTLGEHMGEHIGFAKGDWKGMMESARKNSNTLKKYGYDMTRAIAGNKGTIMWYGSEFRSPDDLRELMSHHAY